MGKNIEIHPSKDMFKNPKPIGLDTARDQRLWINNVSGINKEGQLPARFLTGFLPSFSMAETIRERSNGKGQPVVRIFIPGSISQHVNEIEGDIIDKQVDQATRLVQAMAQVHFPDIEVLIERDQPFTESASLILSGIAQIASGIKSPAMERIKVNGKNRGGEIGERNAELYAAHHVFGWKDLHHAAIFAHEPPFTVVNTMPPSEKIYNDVRGDLLSRLEETDFAPLILNGKHFDLMMIMSDRPHYLLISDQQRALEPTIEEAEGIPTGRIVEDMVQEGEKEEAPWRRNQIRRAVIDMQNLITKLGRGRVDARDATLNELLGIKSLSAVT